ncbi:PQQ-binding-like beta-propeller repeat protein [Candidatus Kaiserbacteria bacterium]|nr:PQQ-binding-like beta-propeller repeat protein [Candidatus Kaiserbacteria bacterium]
MENKQDLLKKIIENKVLVSKENEQIISSAQTESLWLFDFRRIFLDPYHIDLIAEIFWDTYKDKRPFQVCGLEVAAIPLVTAIVMKSVQKGKPVNGFFIRKSRKKDGLMRMFEGTVTDENIIIVDDLINSGKSVMRQLAAIDAIGKKVSDVFTIMHFRELEYYYFLKERDITLHSIFPITTFNIDFKKYTPKKFLGDIFKTEWYFKSNKPSYFYVVQKSTPAFDLEKIYFGSDSGNFWALNQKDGSVAWKYKVGFHPKGKSIFSAPAIHKNTVFFGSYDGNVYALDTQTGVKKWVFMEADWVGSSPALAPDIKTLFIGLEFGLINKRGGIVALDLETGEKKWEHITSQYTHCSPAYFAPEKIVVIGSNDSTVYAYSAKGGKLLWKLQTHGEIKASFAFDEKRKTVIFGSFDGRLYIVDIKTGKIIHTHQAEFGIYSTPTVYKDNVYFTSLDKRLYSINLKTNALNWFFEAKGRIFSSPTVINEKLYIGSNDGRLYELDPGTGEELGFLQVSERITNKVVYNEENKKFFLLTFANEVYCLTRNKE